MIMYISFWYFEVLLNLLSYIKWCVNHIYKKKF